ncbi:hypothetical protein [Anderseniella sp. Alg231-50]|uniref:hypothetical protein n=1 Tax=Anderseniella sp. Alg231-50 TaxID=1922226 RepID=UPI000D54D15B
MKIDLATLEHAKADNVNAELAHLWSLLRNDEITREIARKEGIDLRSIDEIGDLPFAATPLQDGNRADVVTTILVGLAISFGTDALTAAAKAAWAHILKPEIEKRFGKSKDSCAEGT